MQRRDSAWVGGKIVDNPLKNMEPMSGLEPPYGLRITNGDEEDDGID
jgi:hypothetical protein